MEYQYGEEQCKKVVREEEHSVAVKLPKDPLVLYDGVSRVPETACLTSIFLAASSNPLGGTKING